jgi:hypothetical protein
VYFAVQAVEDVGKRTAEEVSEVIERHLSIFCRLESLRLERWADWTPPIAAVIAACDVASFAV